MSLLTAEYRRFHAKCASNDPELTAQLLRALAIIRPGSRYESVA